MKKIDHNSYPPSVSQKLLASNTVPEVKAAEFENVVALQKELTRLLRLEEGWRHALDSSGQGAWSIDVANNEFYYCDGWRKMRGIAIEEKLDVRLDVWLESVHPDDRLLVGEAIASQNAGRSSFTVLQYRERHRNGKWIWVESRSSVLGYDPQGKAVRIVGTDSDISDRKAAEQSLEDMSRTLALAMDVAGIGLFEADLESGQVKRNRRLLELYGLGENTDLLDRNGTLQRDHLHPEDRSDCLKRVSEGIASGQPFNNQFRIITSSGVVRHLRAKSVPYRDNAGRSKLLGVNWDVTGDMEAQEALRELAERARARSEALEEAERTIKQLAIRDELTGVLNRRGLNEQLRLWSADAARFDAVMHLDLDYFKAINDELGHHAGDIVLRTATHRIRAQLGPDDVLARWGGDEFVVLVKGRTVRAYLHDLARAITRSFEGPVEVVGKSKSIGITIGIARNRAELTPEQLIMAADAALYSAKRAGRGRAKFAPEPGDL